MLKYLLALLILPSVCFSQTSLWKVSKNGNELYLGGTIHVLKKEDYPLPVEFTEAFEKADQLVLEANIDMAKTPEFGQKVAKLLTYTAGKSLKDVLKQNTLIKLEKHLTARGIKLDQFINYKPSMIVLVLSMIELQKIGMVEVGVDEYFHIKAKQVGKSIEYFETVDEQLSFISTMSFGNENEIILSTIDEVSQIEPMMAVIKMAWLNGDEVKMTEVAITDMARSYPELYQTILVKRNNRWMSGIERMLTNKKVELILVGSMHLVGNDGLLQQLRNKGYEVKIFSNK